MISRCKTKTNLMCSITISGYSSAPTITCHFNQEPQRLSRRSTTFKVYLRHCQSLQWIRHNLQRSRRFMMMDQPHQQHMCPMHQQHLITFRRLPFSPTKNSARFTWMDIIFLLSSSMCRATPMHLLIQAQYNPQNLGAYVTRRSRALIVFTFTFSSYSCAFTSCSTFILNFKTLATRNRPRRHWVRATYQDSMLVSQAST